MDKSVVAQLQNEYGEIYWIKVGDKEIAYRALTIQEKKQIDSFADSSADIEDMYVQEAVVYPRNFDIDSIKAGHVSALATAIANVSGEDIDFVLNTLDKFRQEAEEDVLISIKAIIIAAMPALSEEYLDSLTIRELLLKLVLSEQILTVNQTVNGITKPGFQLYITRAEEIEEEQPKPQKAKIPVNVDKETLLRRIASEDRETVNTALTPQVDRQALEALDEELLVKAAGYVDSEDPIARKLRQAMGG